MCSNISSRLQGASGRVAKPRPTIDQSSRPLPGTTFRITRIEIREAGPQAAKTMISVISQNLKKN